MRASEFVRTVNKLGRMHGVEVRFEARRGKGSHGRLWFGDRFTTVPMHTGDLAKGTLRAMTRQLGFRLDDLR